jgi:hypothetical protein
VNHPVVLSANRDDATISMTLCFIGRYRNGWGRQLVSHMKGARNGGAGPTRQARLGHRKEDRRSVRSSLT